MFKKVIKKIVRFPFTIKPMDTLIAKLAGNFSDNHFIRKLIPANTDFKKGSLRYCTRNNIRYFLDLSDYQSWLIFFSFKTDSSSDILKYTKTGDVVIDIGGNIGQTAMLIAYKIKDSGKVISFEPYPETYNRFKTNLELNKHLQNVEIVNIGLGDKPGKLEMYQDCITNSGANRIVYKNDNNLAGLKTVEVTTLDNFISQRNLDRINLIKIDVEGFEMKVLLGSKNILNQYIPDMFIEVDDVNLKKQGDSARNVFDFLRALNYKISDVISGKEITKSDSLENCHTDIFCTRNLINNTGTLNNVTENQKNLWKA